MVADNARGLCMLLALSLSRSAFPPLLDDFSAYLLPNSAISFSEKSTMPFPHCSLLSSHNTSLILHQIPGVEQEPCLIYLFFLLSAINTATQLFLVIHIHMFNICLERNELRGNKGENKGVL